MCALADGAVAARSSERKTRQIPFPGQLAKNLHEIEPPIKRPFAVRTKIENGMVAFGSWLCKNAWRWHWRLVTSATWPCVVIFRGLAAFLSGSAADAESSCPGRFCIAAAAWRRQLCLHRRHERLDADDVHDAREVVGQDVQRRLDEHPEKMRQRRETVEHPFGTIKARMGATHFLMKTLPRVAAEMALHVLAYNLTRVMNIMGVQPLMAAMRA